MKAADITNETQVTEQNYNDILKFAKDGNATAQYVIGLYCYDKGKFKEAVSWYTKAAEQNHAVAQNKLGSCFFFGEGIPENKKESVLWCRKSAEQGNLDSQNKLAFCYENGLGIERDENKAFDLYLKAAKSGYSKSQYNLGRCYEDGIGTEKDEKKAFEWYEKSAEQGYSSAQFNLGEFYENGIGTEKDETKAFVWYLKSAEQGYALAQNDLGICYENGIGTEKDVNKAFSWYFKAAEQGFSEAQLNVGLCYMDGIGTEKDVFKSFEWNLKSAKQGLAEAQFYVGCLYLNGSGFDEDEFKAFEWFLKSAQQGFDVAQYYVGFCYENGIGISRNQVQAFGWYLKAANQGFDLAQNDLGICYKTGTGTDKNEEKAFEWFSKAANQELDVAQYNLGVCFDCGIGTGRDEVRAFELYLKSAEQGYDIAQWNVSCCYKDGIGTVKDENKVFEWCLKSAENGYSEAQLRLATCYNIGIGTKQDDAKAFEWYEIAAENGSSVAQIFMASFSLSGSFGVRVDENIAKNWIKKALSDENTLVDYFLGRLYLTHFRDYQNTEKYLLKASENEKLSDSFNWLAVSCFAQRRNTEGFEWAKKSAELDDALGCFILSSAYYHGKGVEKSAEKGNQFYKEAIEKGLEIVSVEALDLDPITEVRLIDFDKLHREDKTYLSSLLKSDLFPKTDFILAKMQKKPSSITGTLTSESIKGTTTRALQNILGVRPLLMEEMLRNKAEKRGKGSPLDSMMVGDMLLPEYYSKKLETFDYTREEDPSKFMDQQVRHARSTAEDYWDNNKYKEIKEVFDYLASSGEEISVLEDENYAKKLLTRKFKDKGERAIDNLYKKVKEEYIRRTSTRVSITSSDEEGEYTIDIKDESVLSPEEAFIQKEEHSENLLKLKQFVKGFDDTLRKGTSKETASIFMVRLLVPSPAKDKGDYEQKMGLTPIVYWLNNISTDFTIDEIKNILAETEFFSADIDWFYVEQLDGKTAINNEEISKKLGIEPAAFTRTYNKTLIPKLIDYWNSHKAELED